ncbi:MAG: type II toxin-antitoxin system VapC family toxin [Candidatus Contendobacter sp.]|nr:type II toxin-antitoxin system VapC family toxin [Candidatus Contendobacter sp.]
MNKFEKPKVYIETSVISYLTAWRSRDLVIAGNQETTKEWWDRRNDFDLFISVFVMEEVSGGDFKAATERLKALEGIPEIEIADQVVIIAEKLLNEASLPSKARVDALHIATAAFGGMDYLLTWNCTHIANPAFRFKIEAVIRSLGYEPPIICTPQELLET